LFRLEISKGHLRWTVTQLARASGISRVTIYSHFGSNKKQILENALRSICAEFFGLTPERQALAKDDFIASARITRDLAEQTPEFQVFYQVWRATRSPYSEILREYEDEYRKKLQKLFPHLTLTQVATIHAALHGAMAAPFLDDKMFAETIKQIMVFASAKETATSVR
jgi:AcrR family transcriptional regulator